MSQQQPPPPAIVEKPRKKRKKRPPHKSKMITGYIIYASEIRKDVIKKYPDRDFGDISKLVGIEWKNLPQETKVAYEKRAQEQNAKSKAITAEAFALKKLAEAAEERAKEQQLQQQQQQNPQSYSQQQQQQQRPQDPYQLPDTNAQYSNNININIANTNGTSPAPIYRQQQQQQQHQQQILLNQTSSPSMSIGLTPNQHSTPQQYTRNNAPNRTPAALLRQQRPKDATTQSESIKWIRREPQDPPKFSQKFIDYLAKNESDIMAQLSSD